MAARQEHVANAVSHLQNADPVMRRVIHQAGPFTLKPERDRFFMLVRSIISQQISVKAARSIRDRLVASVAPRKIAPDVLLELSPEDLRLAGISPQKSRYLLDLAAKVDSGAVRLQRVGRMTDEAVIEELVQVQGIGRWTAEMFLIFALGRMDVFPVGDLGVRNAMKNLYRVADDAPHSDYHTIAEMWKPYRSVAAWYCWRSLENTAPAEPADTTGFPS